MTKKDSSKRQQYLLYIYQTVKAREFAPDLAVKDPSPLSNSRWLTCANNFSRLCIFDVKPSEEIKMLVSFMMMKYFPV